MPEVTHTIPHLIRKNLIFMGTCEYVLAEGCDGSRVKEFAVLVKNTLCGFRRKSRPSCTESVKILLAGDKIQLTRDPRFVVINHVKISSFPVVKTGKQAQEMRFNMYHVQLEIPSLFLLRLN